MDLEYTVTVSNNAPGEFKLALQDFIESFHQHIDGVPVTSKGLEIIVDTPCPRCKVAT